MFLVAQGDDRGVGPRRTDLIHEPQAGLNIGHAKVDENGLPPVAEILQAADLKLGAETSGEIVPESSPDRFPQAGILSQEATFTG